MSALFIPISSCQCDTQTHNSYNFCTGSKGGTSPCVLWSEKLAVYLLRNSMHSSMTLVLMFIKPWHVIYFSLLTIKSRDVTPWGLVDRPKQFGGTCCPPLQGMRVLSFWHWRWKCQVPPRYWYLCALHTMNP